MPVLWTAELVLAHASRPTGLERLRHHEAEQNKTTDHAQGSERAHGPRLGRNMTGDMDDEESFTNVVSGVNMTCSGNPHSPTVTYARRHGDGQPPSVSTPAVALTRAARLADNTCSRALGTRIDLDPAAHAGVGYAPCPAGTSA